MTLALSEAYTPPPFPAVLPVTVKPVASVTSAAVQMPPPLPVAVLLLMLPEVRFKVESAEA